MKKKTLPVKTVYYTDEEKDEFSTAVIPPRVIDEGWQYLSKNPLWYVARFFLYRVIALPIAFIYCKLKLGYRVENRRALRQAEKGGYFIYGNHTQAVGDALMPSLAQFPKSVYTIVHPSNVSIPFIGPLTPYMGALPLPSGLKAMKGFKCAIGKRLSEGCGIMIYPEAHIWPYCTQIRNFPDTSMRYPVEYDRPAFVMTTTYHRRRRGIKPRIVVYIDGPLYPDKDLPPKARAKHLRDRIYDVMMARCAESDCEYIRYLPKEESNEASHSSSLRRQP